MTFRRTDSGVAVEHRFYPKILVYVEGHTDIPFYDEVLRNYDCWIKAQGGKPECKKLAEDLKKYDRPYVVILDGDYEILEHTRSQHRRVVWLHRHSYENYLLEEEPIKQFCRDRVRSEDSLEEPLTSNKFTEFTGDIEVKFKDLLVLDVAHQRSKTGQEPFFRTPDRFFKRGFRDSEIEKQSAGASENIDRESMAQAKELVEKFLRTHRLIDLLPGHFAFGLMRSLISDTVGKSISNDDIRLYLSREVWQLVKTRDHRSLKRRLQTAVREAKQMRESNRSHTQ